MKEIALTGLNGHVFAEVLSRLLHSGYSVNAMVSAPERLMVENTCLTVSHLDAESKDALRRAFDGYDDVVMTFEDRLDDHDTNTFVLEHFTDMVVAAREAGVRRLIVVGSPQSEAFFTGTLRRQDGIDARFISTEGDYARHTDEALKS